MKGAPDLELHEAAALLAADEISALELTEASLARAQAIAPLNAFLRIDADAARAAARTADAERARGLRRGPLHGIPLAHKDMFYRAGVPSSCGSKVHLPLPATTSTALARLDAAGAIQTGVLHMAEFAFNPTGHNASLGHCRNPWDPARITGGSSSGSAVAVAAGAAYGALGTDTGASVRLPAAFNGVTGLKTTYGRVSRAGALGLAHSLDTVGPIARSARDCALLLDAIAGPDAADPVTAGHAATAHAAGLREPVTGLRIGVATRYFEEGLADSVGAAMEACRGTLRGLGCTLRSVDPGDLAPVNAAATLVMLAEAAGVHGQLLRDQGEAYTRQVRTRIERGFAISAPQYLDALRYRAIALEQFLDRVFTHVDALLVPITPMAAPTIAESDIRDGPELDSLLGRLTRFLRVFNYLGLPALSLPAGSDAHGVPVGVQLVGRPFAEALLLRIGHAFQGATDWHTRRPPLPEVQPDGRQQSPPRRRHPPPRPTTRIVSK